MRREALDRGAGHADRARRRAEHAGHQADERALARAVRSDESQQLAFGGTSILIAVGVALETMKQIDSQLMMRNYEGFLK